MKNNIFYNLFIATVFVSLNLNAQELEINSTKIKYDDIKEVTVLEGNVKLKDDQGNRLFSEYATYNKLDGLIETTGETKIITSDGYEVLSSDVKFNNNSKKIFSNYKTQIKDIDGNKVLVDMFSYSTSTNIFFSKGDIKVFDINNNNYNFSEIYIDGKSKKIIGSDIKAFLNQKNFLVNSDNEPRFFANSMSLSNNISTFDKGIFTYCKIREDGKCPPWTLQSDKIKHDLAKKTIYYDNVILKIYDFPIFYSPKFSHPDPTVKRQSGFLIPAQSNSSNLGLGLSIPYFLNIANDRDLTFTPKLYFNENPLMLAQYRQDIKNSFFIADTGVTQGYKKTNNKKSSGNRAHFFSKFNMSLIDEGEKNSNLEINLQKVSNDTYFKIYDIDTTLVDKNQSVLENSIDFQYQNEDFYFGLSPSVYENITKVDNLRYEYFLPMSLEKSIIASENFGFVDLNTDLKIRNYETNKQTNILVNDINWKSNTWLNKLGFENSLEAQIKAVNYNARNTIEYKNDEKNAELNSVLGYFSKLNLYKNDIINKNFQTLTPKFLMRYAPGHMRKTIDLNGRLDYGKIFSLDKINEIGVIEDGLSTSIGFEYKKNKLDKENKIGDEVFSFAVGQVISAQENTKMPASTSLDQRFSDVVGKTTYKINNKFSLNYNFSLDQNYKEINYNEIEADIDFKKTKFNIGYLEEKEHIGNQQFIESKLEYNLDNSTSLSFETKRNLLTSSAEFYNLSYNYINDCLEAGIAYRREFYEDRDIEAENRLMFTISIIPFSNTNVRNPRR